MVVYFYKFSIWGGLKQEEKKEGGKGEKKGGKEEKKE